MLLISHGDLGTITQLLQASVSLERNKNGNKACSTLPYTQCFFILFFLSPRTYNDHLILTAYKVNPFIGILILQRRQKISKGVSDLPKAQFIS